MKQPPRTLGRTLREAADWIEALDSPELEIKDIAVDEAGLEHEGTLAVDLVLELSLFPTHGEWDILGEETDAITIHDDGTLRLPVTVAVPSQPTDGDETGGTVASEISMDSLENHDRETVPNRPERTENGQTPTADTTDGESTDDDPEISESPSPNGDHVQTASGTASNNTESSQPAYRDPTRLRAVYDQYETFEEMTEALDVDVTPQTVRRHMIKHDIHDPSPRDLVGSESGSETGTETKTEAEPEPANETETDTEAEAEATDSASVVDEPTDVDAQHPVDAKLPADVTLTEFAEALHRSRTVQETSHELDLDVDTTRTLLKKLDLFDIVLGRIDSNGDDDLSIDAIEERVQSAATRI